MKNVLALLVVLFFVVSCGGGEEINLPDFTPVETPEQMDFTPDFVPSDRDLADADHLPEEIVTLFVDSFDSDSAKARIIEQIRENVPCDGGFDNDTDEEVWDGLLDWFPLDRIENYGSNLEEAVRNLLVSNLNVEPGISAEEVWSEIADYAGGC